MVTINRLGIMLERVEDIRSMIDWAKTGWREDESFSQMEVFHVANRFGLPAETGYRDLKIYIRHTSGMVSCWRISSRKLDRSSFYSTSQPKLEILRRCANEHLYPKGIFSHSVIVSDNFLKDESDSTHLIRGFKSQEEASTYGLSRIHQSISEMKAISNSVEDLIDNWLLFGESVALVLEDGVVALDQSIEARIIENDIPRIPHWSGDGNSYAKFALDYCNYLFHQSGSGPS